MVVALASVDCFLNGHETSVNWRRDFCCPKLAVRKCQWRTCSSAAARRLSLLLIHVNIPYIHSTFNSSVHSLFPRLLVEFILSSFQQWFCGCVRFLRSLSLRTNHPWLSLHSLRSISIFGRFSKLDLSYTSRQQNVFHANTLIRRNPTRANDSY
jgi:hypothetical protein